MGIEWGMGVNAKAQQGQQGHLRRSPQLFLHQITWDPHQWSTMQ